MEKQSAVDLLEVGPVHLWAYIYAAGDEAVALSGRTGASEKTAYHEAGHAATALALGKVPVAVEIFANGGGGFTDFKGDAGETKPRTDAEALEWLQGFPLGSEQPLDLGDTTGDVRQILLANWPAVQAIAENLLQQIIGAEHGRLTRRQLELLFQFNAKTEVKCSEKTSWTI
jgi:hypothetical protein